VPDQDDWQRAIDLIDANRVEEGKALLTRLSESGLWQASTYLGRLALQECFRSPTCCAQAKQYFALAVAQHDCAETRLDMARFFYFGSPHKPPDFRAAHMHLSQVLAGMPQAAIMCAELALSGAVQDVDLDAAKKHFTSAMMAGYPAAHLGLSRLAARERRYVSAIIHFFRALWTAIRLVKDDPRDERLVGIGARYGNFRIGKVSAGPRPPTTK